MIHGDQDRDLGSEDQRGKTTVSEEGNTQGYMEIGDKTKARQEQGEDEDEVRTRTRWQTRREREQGQGQGQGEDNRVIGQ